MKYAPEVIEAVGVVMEALGALPGAVVVIPTELATLALERGTGPQPQDLMDLWNTMRDERLPACVKLNDGRRRQCAARLREFPRREDWEAFIKGINSNNWLLGATPSPGWPNWKANFDWFIRPTNILRFLEGGFRQDFTPPATARESYADELERRNFSAE